MPRGGKKSHKGMSRRFTAPEEIERQNNDPNYEWRKKKPKDEESEEEKESSEEESSEEEGATGSDKHKGIQHLIEVENPNRVKSKMQKISQLSTNTTAKPEISRKEREAANAERAKADYERRHQAGLTEEAQADLARLALVRKQREETAKKREEEKAAKDAASKGGQGDAFKKTSQRGGKSKSGK